MAATPMATPFGSPMNGDSDFEEAGPDSKRLRIALTNANMLVYDDDEKVGSDSVMAMEDAASLYMDQLRRRDLRLEELAKFEAFGCFLPVPREEAHGLLFCRWVDTLSLIHI